MGVDRNAAPWSFPQFSGRLAPVGTDQDWKRLATYVTKRREELTLTQAGVEAAGGPSIASMRRIEDGEQTNYTSALLVKLERALQWGRGSADKILAGGEPDLLSNGAARLSAPPVSTQEAERLIDESDLPPERKERMRRRLHESRELMERQLAEQVIEDLRMWREIKGA
jgi:hypothetical protein